MSDENFYLYALTTDPGKPLREANETIRKSLAEIVQLIAERERLTAERDEARRRNLLLLSKLQEYEAREQ